MRTIPRKPAVVILLALVMSLAGVITPPAAHAEQIPTLQHPPIVTDTESDTVTGPDGTVTMPCDSYDSPDLKTYDASGQLVRQIPVTPQIDGVDNCITEPIVDKDGTLYGVPYGQKNGGGHGYGSNLLAYDGNTLKWKYPLACSTNGGASYVVGADGNIYATTRESNGDVHLIGLTPEVVPPLTGPAKVLDVVIPVSCATKMYAYKDGIMVHDQQHGHGWYYSYSGQFLGQASIGDIWDEKLNAQGQLFVASYVGGDPRSVSISMYDPLTDKVMWTASASTSGADTNGFDLRPLAGGGVAALITEQKMSGGAPVVPEEWVETLVVINGAGIKTELTQLPNEDGQNTTFDRSFISADGTGKVILVREMYQKTTTSWPSKVPAIDIKVYDPTSDTVTYHEVMSGDADDPDEPYGFQLSGYGDEGAAYPTSDTVNIVAYCRWDCPNDDRDTKVYPVEVNGLGRVYPRNVVSNVVPSVPYVALGDSYSSGEGVLPFENGTETTGTNTCHRSHNAYARVVGRTTSLDASLGMGGFYACSGAVTQNIAANGTDPATPQWNEGTQVSHLDADTKVVTLTIGGNDVGFVPFAKACVLTTCKVGTNAYSTSRGEIDNNLGAKLTATYQAILNAAPNAQVYVLGYPHVAPVKTAGDPNDPRCGYLFNSGVGDSWGDAQAARDLVTRLNAKISDQVNGVNDAHLHFIDPNASGSPFVGHTVCADPGESYFNNLDQWVGHEAFALHPNQRGQAAYAQLVAEALN